MRNAAAPGAFACAAITIYMSISYGAEDPKKPAPVDGATVASAATLADPGDPVSQPLTAQQSSFLSSQKWDSWVGNGTGVWVSVDEQMFRIVRAGTVVWQAPCATAAAGTGSKMNSQKTPLGWHSVKKKIGGGAPLGQVFRSAQPTKELWKPGQKTKEDLVLTRVLWLTGEEPGKNLGGDVDSYSRYIYIHGTNEEEKIGTPSSHGCVRLKNADVVAAFDLIVEGMPVLISETKPTAQ